MNPEGLTDTSTNSPAPSRLTTEAETQPTFPLGPTQSPRLPQKFSLDPEEGKRPPRTEKKNIQNNSAKMFQSPGGKKIIL